jgi:hypothetical protein
MIVHVPGPTGLSIESETVQTDGVCELNETCSPDDADAVKVTWCPIVVSRGWGKVIVWERTTGLTWNDRVTALTAVAPVSEAVIVQVPDATGLATEPDTVHTDSVSEVSVTVRARTRNLSVIDALNGTWWPTVVFGGWLKWIVTETWLTADCEPRASVM